VYFFWSQVFKIHVNPNFGIGLEKIVDVKKIEVKTQSLEVCAKSQVETDVATEMLLTHQQILRLCFCGDKQG